MSSARRHIVIGIGNPDRGDDAVGRAVARQLRGTLPSGVEIIEHDGEATSLLALLERADIVCLIDACTSSVSPGTVQRFDVGVVPLPLGTFAVSTHGPGLAEAVELVRVLGQLPSRCIVYAIEAGSFAPGASLTSAVEAATAEVCKRVRAEFASAGASGERADA